MKKGEIFISGVSKRLGLHMAHRFLDRGFSVIGTYRSTRQGLSALESKGAHLIHCDFYKESKVQELINIVKADYNKLRAVIHNASDWMPDDADIPAAEIIRRMMKVHTEVPYQLNLEFKSLLLNQERGAADIIHIGDFVSSKGSKKHIAYAASKAAQDNLTLSFAADLAPSVKVNSIAPALVLFGEQDTDDYKIKAKQKSLMQCEGGLDEFQRCIDFIMESDFITGRILPLDGGRHLK